jgi:hypothetical protein
MTVAVSVDLVFFGVCVAVRGRFAWSGGCVNLAEVHGFLRCAVTRVTVGLAVAVLDFILY